jgi:Family of unknown function (DUF6516)
VTPEHIRDLESLWIWLEGLIDNTGAVLADSAALVVQPATLTDSYAPPWLALMIEKQRLIFADGSYLSFSMQFDDDLNLVRYSFHYCRADGTRWRYDKHWGHETEDGGPCHVHTDDNKRLPSDPVDLEWILSKIMDEAA